MSLEDGRDPGGLITEEFGRSSQEREIEATENLFVRFLNWLQNFLPSREPQESNQLYEKTWHKE